MGTCAYDKMENTKTNKNKKYHRKSRISSETSSSESQIRKVVDDCFNRFDTNHNGVLDFAEVC